MQGRSSLLCVVVDEILPLTMITASLSSSSRVISLLPGLGVNGLRYLERVAEKNGFSLDQIQVLGKKAKELTVDDTEGKKVYMQHSFLVPTFKLILFIFPFFNKQYYGQ